MSTHRLCMLLFSVFVLVSCTNNSDDEALLGVVDKTVGLQTKAGTQQVAIQWNSEQQEIDGFGVAQAGWADRLYAHKKRDDVMGMLFGTQGLHLSILRGEVFPHYWENETDKDFDLDANIDLPLSDPFFNDMTLDLLRRGQLWVTRTARQTYQVDKLMFSTWSPPAYMKDNNNVSKGTLKPAYYQAYAEYLAEFCKAYQSVGLDVYAISPANEPEYPAEWNSCKWLPAASTMGKFLTQNMGPVFKQTCPTTKIIFGENAQWSKYSVIIATMGSEKYVEDIINAYPQIGDIAQIASGHGYPHPLTKKDLPIVPYTKAEQKGMKVWLTEVSKVDALDPSMEDGLKWAVAFHQYLATANVSAIIWWAGAQPTTNNESLIVLNSDREGYSFTKRYETFGNYTRYIPVGSKRINVQKGTSLPSEVLLSSFKKGTNYTVVAVNPTNNAVNTELFLEGVVASGNLKQVITNADNRWMDGAEITPTETGIYPITLPAKSVITYIGSIE